MSFSMDDARRVAQILSTVAQAEVMPHFNRLRASEVRTKTSAIDLVTDADEAAERAITAALKAAFPGAVVIGEEATAADPSLLDGIATAPLCLIVDPIDGTRNFVAGLPLFGTMAGVTMRGEVVAGVIHDPVGRNTAIAVRGEGAWMEAEDGGRQAMHVAEAPAQPTAMDGLVGITHLPEPMRSTVARNIARLASFGSLRCAAHEYRLIAGGHSHVSMYNKLMPWDHAAGWLLHREAGGFSAHLDGTEYLPMHIGGGLLCAPDEASWHAARTLLLTD